MTRRLFGKRRVIGSSYKHSYDIPLNKGAGTGFLLLLVALMTFLALIALSASFMLGDMTGRWSSGLENKITIEIPSSTDKNHTRKREEIEKVAERMKSLLDNHPAVKNVSVLGERQIAELVSPWLGENFSMDNIPVPGLISMEIENSEKKTIENIRERIKAIDENSRIDTHEKWLNDLLRFTGSLQFGAFLLVLIVGVTTVTAIAGAIRTLMAVHSEEIELLHLMGAGDEYITRQFQKHSLILAVKGGIAGGIAASVAIYIISELAGEMDVALLPEFSMQFSKLLALFSTPVVIGIIAMLTARITVLKALSKMP
jgi:cell division transport system permease protein